MSALLLQFLSCMGYVMLMHQLGGFAPQSACQEGREMRVNGVGEEG